jgi:hypothetical protein
MLLWYQNGVELLMMKVPSTLVMLSKLLLLLLLLYTSYNRSSVWVIVRLLLVKVVPRQFFVIISTCIFRHYRMQYRPAGIISTLPVLVDHCFLSKRSVNIHGI